MGRGTGVKVGSGVGDGVAVAGWNGVARKVGVRVGGGEDVGRNGVVVGGTAPNVWVGGSVEGPLHAAKKRLSRIMLSREAKLEGAAKRQGRINKE